MHLLALKRKTPPAFLSAQSEALRCDGMRADVGEIEIRIMPVWTVAHFIDSSAKIWLTFLIVITEKMLHCKLKIGISDMKRGPIADIIIQIYKPLLLCSVQKDLLCGKPV